MFPFLELVECFECDRSRVVLCLFGYNLTQFFQELGLFQGYHGGLGVSEGP